MASNQQQFLGQKTTFMFLNIEFMLKKSQNFIREY